MFACPCYLFASIALACRRPSRRRFVRWNAIRSSLSTLVDFATSRPPKNLGLRRLLPKPKMLNCRRANRRAAQSRPDLTGDFLARQTESPKCVDGRHEWPFVSQCYLLPALLSPVRHARRGAAAGSTLFAVGTMTEKFMRNISLRTATSDDAAFALHVTEACGLRFS